MSDGTSQFIVALLGAGGGGAFLTAIVSGIVKWISGSSHRERLRNTDLISQRTAAIEARTQAEISRDAADRKRRAAEEYISNLRRQLIELGIKPHERPMLITDKKDS